jgi:hypothetical protein
LIYVLNKIIVWIYKHCLFTGGWGWTCWHTFPELLPGLERVHSGLLHTTLGSAVSSFDSSVLGVAGGSFSSWNLL